MLRTVIIMTGAGVMIFEKVWVESKLEKTKLFGSLITGMLEFSRQSTGMVASYLEFDQVAISIVDDTKAKLICTLVHDIEDGADFGKIIATQILRAFLEMFSDVNFSVSAMNVTSFIIFNNKLLDAIGSSVKNILSELQSNRAVKNALVIYDNGKKIETPIQEEEDQFALIANLQNMISSSKDIMAAKKKEIPKVLTLEMTTYIVFVHRVVNSSLVSICRKAKAPSLYMPSILQSLELLEKVFKLIYSLTGKN